MARKTRAPRPPRPVQAPERRQQPKAAGFSRRATLTAAAAALAVVAAIAIALAFPRGSSSPPKPVAFAALPGLHTGAPPWNNGNGNLPDKLPLVHLDALSQEGVALHIHQHLDVFVNGKRVTVPALVGIYANSFITEVHTHDASGIIHLESPKNRQFSLGQFFGEWGVRLSASCLGRYCGNLHWWLNGKRQPGNPALLVLSAHQEIAIASGDPPARIPSSYAFAAGL